MGIETIRAAAETDDPEDPGGRDETGTHSRDGTGAPIYLKVLKLCLFLLNCAYATRGGLPRC